MTPNQKLKTLESLVAEASRRIKKLREENVRLQAEVRDLRERAGKLEGEHRDGRRADEKLARARGKIEKLIGLIEKLERRTGPDKRPTATPALPAELADRQSAVAPAAEPVPAAAAAEAPPPQPSKSKTKLVPLVGLEQHELPFSGGDR